MRPQQLGAQSRTPLDSKCREGCLGDDELALRVAKCVDLSGGKRPYGCLDQRGNGLVIPSQCRLDEDVSRIPFTVFRHLKSLVG